MIFPCNSKVFAKCNMFIFYNRYVVSASAECQVMIECVKFLQDKSIAILSNLQPSWCSPHLYRRIYTYDPLYCEQDTTGARWPELASAQVVPMPWTNSHLCYLTLIIDIEVASLSKNKSSYSVIFNLHKR